MPQLRPHARLLTCGNDRIRGSNRPRRARQRSRGMETTCMRGALMEQRSCDVPECERPAKTRGWCRTHYDRWRTTGDPGSALVRAYRISNCSVDGCTRSHRASGYCETHYTRWKKNGTPGAAGISPRDPNRVCEVDGCETPVKGHGLCPTHLARQRRTGSTGTSAVKHLTDPAARNEAGDKRCPSCETWLPISDYTLCASTPDGLYKRCRRCTRSAVLWRSYGLTLEAYEAMLERQGGACLICSTPPESPYSLHVDHDHACCETRKKCCGKCVRGLLCSPCNTALGLLKDDPRRIRAAAAYLERPRD